MMNGFLAASMLATVMLGLSGCGGMADNVPASSEKIKIVATNFALYDFARVYESAGIDAQMLIAPGSESHDLEATLSDISVISSADIFVYAGGESDKWVDDVFEALGDAGEGIVRICALDLVEAVHEEHVHENGESHSGEDEHVWTSIPNAELIINEIRSAILRCDETKASALDSAGYIAELERLDKDYREAVASAERNNIVVADRFPFVYMAQEYGLEYTAAFDGCTSNVEVPLAVINSLISEVKSDGIPAVFYIEFSDMTAVNSVCGETGAAPLLLHSCHNVTKAEFESGVTYLDLMRQNLENLKTALN